MQIELLCIGRVKEEFYRKRIREIESRLNKCCSFSACQLPDIPIPKNAGGKEEERVRTEEGLALLRHIQEHAYVIALCIEGRELDSRQHSSVLRTALQSGCSSVIYVIGGSLGLSKAVTDRADYRLSFSKMTFPHQLMRVMLMEELSNIVPYL